MIVRFHTVVAAMLVMSLCAPATAQRYDGEVFGKPELVTGTRFKRAAETAQEGEARQMQRDVARCVFDRNKADTRELLAHSDFNRIDFDALEVEPGNLFEEFKVAECIGRAMKHSQYRVQMRMPFNTLRNLLAEEAYVRDNKDAVVVPAGAPVNLENRYNYDRMGPRSAAIAELSDCIVHAQPAEADAFIRTRPGTKKEALAIEALSPALGPCLGTDAPPEVGASLMRQVVADGLWARAHYGPLLAAETTDEMEAE